ncbi:MAG: AAA family ATPase [Candidatus Thiodiazotropha sp. (ex Epidulcina cf. delphinae)]|nr:AAA family ATPase [Candidatus Thiodiazotropha sp. (ex Epidulcina cf. delphinae)]
MASETALDHSLPIASDSVGDSWSRMERRAWVDGPLVAVVRAGGICYLSEVVKVR